MEEAFLTLGGFYDWVATQPEVVTVAEIGVWKGESIAYLADRMRDREGVRLYAVDLFDRSYAYADFPFFAAQIPDIRSAYEATLRRTATRQLIIDVPERSDRAAERFPEGSSTCLHRRRPCLRNR